MSKTTSLWLTVGAVATSAAIGALFGANVEVNWRGSTSVDAVEFVTIVLSALAVMLAILTIFLAVLGFIGFATINKRLENHSRSYFTNELKEGRPAFTLLKQVVRDIVYEGIEPVPEERDFEEGESDEPTR